MRIHIVVATAILVANAVQGQQIINVGSEPACSSCAIHLRQVATLVGSDDIVVALSRDSRAVLQGDRLLVAPTYTPGQVAVFDMDGALQRTFGRQGRGPGELTGRGMKVLVGPGDSVHVLDASSWNLFSPDYKYVRSRNLPASPLDGRITQANELVVSYTPNLTTEFPGGVHVMSLASNVERWLDTEGYENVPSVEAVRLIATTPDAIWVARPNRYDLTRYSTVDGSATIWRQDGGWLRPWTDLGASSPFHSVLQSGINGIQVQDSTITVYGRTPNPGWRPPVIPRGQEIPRSQVDLARSSRGLIEIVQRRTGAVLARLQTDQIHLPLRGSTNLALVTRALPSGEIAIDIVEIVLVAG